MSMGAGYIRQQYGNAVATLCTDPRPIRERLETAVRESLVFASDPGPDMPRTLARAVSDLHARVTTSAPAVGDEGTAFASVWLLTEEQASDVAREVLALHSQMESAYYRPDQWHDEDG